MKKVLLLLSITSLLLSFSLAEAQAQKRSRKEAREKYRFNAGLILGINYSQIDGDLRRGYNKKGLRAGLKSLFYLNETFDITTAILFVQRGSRFKAFNRGSLDGRNDRKIHLDFIEIPLLITYKIYKPTGLYRLDVGGSFGRLINANVKEIRTRFIEDVFYSDLIDDFDKNEFNFMMAGSYFPTNRVGVGVQYTYQLNRLYFNPEYTYDPSLWQTSFRPVEFLRNYQFGFFLTYHLN